MLRVRFLLDFLLERLNLEEAVHAVGQLRVVDDRAIALALELGAGLVLADGVGRHALVDAVVLRIRPEEIERHVIEVVLDDVAGRGRQRLTVAQPLNAHGRIADGYEFGLEASRIAFAQVQHGLELRLELGRNRLVLVVHALVVVQLVLGPQRAEHLAEAARLAVWTLISVAVGVLVLAFAARCVRCVVGRRRHTLQILQLLLDVIGRLG